MAASIVDIRKLAQVMLRDKGFYSGEIDGLWGKGSNAAFAEYSGFLRTSKLEIGGEDAIVEDAMVEDAGVGRVSGVVVLDPGHGGTHKTGGSSPNNATSSSGVAEKTMTLELAKLVRKELNRISSARPHSKYRSAPDTRWRPQPWSDGSCQSCPGQGCERVCQHPLQRL